MDRPYYKAYFRDKCSVWLDEQFFLYKSQDITLTLPKRLLKRSLKVTTMGAMLFIRVKLKELRIEQPKHDWGGVRRGEMTLDQVARLLETEEGPNVVDHIWLSLGGQVAA